MNVEELRKNDFDKKLNVVKWREQRHLPDSAGFIFVYATWCETCHQLKPWYDNLGRYWENEFHLGSVNAMDIENENDKLTAEWGIDGYPVFYFVRRDGRVSRMNVKLNKDYIYDSMLEMVDKVRSERGE